MARYRRYDQKQMFLSPIDPERLRLNDPLMERVDWFVEQHVDVGRFEVKVRNEEGGAEAIHPKLLLKVIFYANAKGIYSAREMERRLGSDPYFQVLAANETIDHSSICNFLNGYRQEIEQVFCEMAYVLQKMGYLDNQLLAVDGTKIQANVGREFVLEPREYLQKKKQLAKKIEELLGKSQEEILSSSEQSRLQRLQKKQDKIDRFFEQLKNMENPPEESQKIHLNDPDARLVKDKDQFYMGYNGQIIVDGGSDLIVATDLFNEPTDARLFQPMMRRLTGSLPQTALQRSQIVTDSGYFSSENLVFAESNRIDAYIPEGKAEGGTKKKPAGKITSKDCQLEKDGEIRRLTCPANQVMQNYSVVFSEGKKFYVFTPNLRACQPCVLKDICWGQTKKKRFKVKKEYFDSLEVRKRMLEKLATSIGKQNLQARGGIVEHVFGSIKSTFRRFLHHGLQKVRLTWRLLCMAWNFKRWLSLDRT